ncbi:MAG: response regulator [Clostridia bacterium]|nr:response regulator [Clostridia bacterium]
MKVLLADSDRDFLKSFKKLLELDGHEVTAVFDGTQVIRKTAKHQYDLVVLERGIPSMKSHDIVRMLNEAKTPVIILLGCKINSDILLDDVLAKAYLSFPFFPYELTELTQEITDKLSSDEKLQFADAEISVADFMLCGKILVTNEEINVFRALLHGSELNTKKAEPYINSLNNKLEKLNKKPRIRYLMGKGYRLVTDYE